MEVSKERKRAKSGRRTVAEPADKKRILRSVLEATRARRRVPLSYERICMETERERESERQCWWFWSGFGQMRSTRGTRPIKSTICSSLLGRDEAPIHTRALDRLAERPKIDAAIVPIYAASWILQRHEPQGKNSRIVGWGKEKVWGCSVIALFVFERKGG